MFIISIVTRFFVAFLVFFIVSVIAFWGRITALILFSIRFIIHVKLQET
jgi:hypothetical protein